MHTGLLCFVLFWLYIMHHGYINVWLTVYNVLFGHEWGESPMTPSRMKIFGESPHESQNKSLFTVSHTSFYFLHAILYFELTRTRWKQTFSVPMLLITVYSNPLFWHHTNARHWYCDVISCNWSCTCKLLPSWYSLVNIDREYRSPVTRYSPCGM